METYPLRVENLPKYIAQSELFSYFNSNSLQGIEVFCNGSTSTAILFFNRLDDAYKFMNLRQPVIGGNPITIVPELVQEMLITLNADWLREINKDKPSAQDDIRAIAKRFKLETSQLQGDTISIKGVPWRMRQAKASITEKMQAAIKYRSGNVQKHLNIKHSHLNVAGVQSVESKYSGQLINLVDEPNVNEQQKHSKLTDQHSSGATSLDVDTKCLSGLSDPNPGKRRQRILKTDDPISGKIPVDEVIKPKNEVDELQPKEANSRKRILKTNPNEAQKSESLSNAVGESPPASFPDSTQYKAVLPVEVDIHIYLLEHSKKLNFTDCSVTQLQVSEERFDWIIGCNNEKDLQFDTEDLKRVIKKLRVECYAIPDCVDFDVFRIVIETDNQNKEVTLIFNPNVRTCRVVGPPDEVKSTKKWISQTVDGIFRRSQQKTGKDSASGVSGESCWPEKGRSAQQLDVVQTGSDWQILDYKSDISDTGNKQSRFPDPKQQLTKASDGIRIAQSSKDRLEFATRGNLRVSVYQGNMIKQQTEAIVSPANECLAHGGGLARVILDAGGPVIDEESRKIISKRNKLQTSEVVHTSAGKLPPPIKYVIHAVGPTAYQFKDNKAGLIPTLKITFRNCLEYANDVLSVSSVSLPPISSGIFAVPMPDIIQGAFEAIKDFDRMKNPTAVLNEVHFISNDAKTTEEMISCFLNVIGGR